MIASYGHLIKNINMVGKVQRSFTKFISGMEGLSYPERLIILKLYSLQRRRERYIIIYVWKISEGPVVPNISLLYVLKHRIVEGGPVSRHTLMLDDREHWSITVLYGVPSVCLADYLCVYVMLHYVRLIASLNNWI